ncbi:MAG: CDP-alcohol phosphatidyltransferase family protein [Candidatus Aminicenantaceae bacterium]
MNKHGRRETRILPRGFLDFFLMRMNRIAEIFIRLRITPNTISTAALIIGLGAGILFAVHQPVWAVLLIALSGGLDILDGRVAAKTNRASSFGAIFDSSLDRYSEFFIYLGLAVHFRNHWILWVIFFTILGSMMVSYTRARAEGLGFPCDMGLMQRAERMMLLFLGAAVGLIFNVYLEALSVVLILTALVSNITAVQRIFHVRKMERDKSN